MKQNNQPLRNKPTELTRKAQNFQNLKISKDKEIDEKDSTAGLMVWEDLKPAEEDDTLRSPHYKDELGASSELGIEVLDDAKGPVQEVLTLYSVQEAVQDETILSHSSLKENEDWIKIESQKLDEIPEIEVPDLVDPLQKSDKEIEHDAPEIVEETTTLDSNEVISSENVVESKGPPEEEENAEKISVKKEEEEMDKVPVQKESEELAVKSVDGEIETFQPKSKSVSFEEQSNLKPISEITETKSTEGHTKSILSIKSADVPITADDLPVTDNVVEVKFAESSTGSIGLGESITVERFVRDGLNNGTVTYSTGEIRKGVYGHQSHEQIERDSSERVVKAAETVHRLGTVEDDSSVLLPAAKSSSDNFSSQDTPSFLVLEEFWQEVPGIGPVIPEPQILAVVEYMQYWGTKQEGMVMPRNINHILCPPLDPLPSNDDEDDTSHY